MRLRLIPVLLAPLLISACKVTNEYKEPELKPIQIQLSDKDLEIPANLLVCDKTDQNITNAQTQNAIPIHGFSDYQDEELTDCAGKKTLKPKMPLNDFEAVLQIDPPDELKSKVNFVEVSNARTCVDRIIVADADQTAKDQKQFAANPYELSQSGSVKIGLNNSMISLNVGLNVADGQNLVTVIYYGRCLSGADFAKCEKGEELGRKTVLVNATVERRDLNGIWSNNTCIKSTTP